MSDALGRPDVQSHGGRTCGRGNMIGWCLLSILRLTAMYEQMTHGVRVRVVPQYLEDRSTPEDGHYFWAYTIEIANVGREPVQLRARHWRITDANGHTEEVRGPGVVGETPVIDPGKSFTYTSGCPLRTPSGLMVGTYAMTAADGRAFEVAIPAFSLDSPFARPRRLN
jgi:ApaG protein